MATTIKYNKVKVLKITETQFLTLNKLAGYKINTCQFIRDAINEKIKREYKNLIPKAKEPYCHF